MLLCASGAYPGYMSWRVRYQLTSLDKFVGALCIHFCRDYGTTGSMRQLFLRLLQGFPQLTDQASVVAAGNFYNHRCRVEDLVTTKVVEDGFTVRWGHITKYTAAFFPPMHHVQCRLVVQQRGEKLTLSVLVQQLPTVPPESTHAKGVHPRVWRIEPEEIPRWTEELLFVYWRNSRAWV